MVPRSLADAALKTRAAARSLKPLLATARVHARAVARGARLPPGSLRRPAEDSLDDSRLLLGLAELHGPVFKAWLDGKVTTCILGIARGRRFLSENEGSIRAATTDFVPLFPHGTLRQMTGDTHRGYRRIFIEAFKSISVAEHRPAVDRILNRLSNDLIAARQPVSFERVRAMLKESLTEVLFRLILGVDKGWHGFDELKERYERFAPNGTFIVVRPAHRDTYAGMRMLIGSRADELRATADFRSLLGQLAVAGEVDETSIGNLIQMIEAGRFDMMGLWAWLIEILGENAPVVDQIARHDDRDGAALCEAVVFETLRLEQSEFVLRVATSDIRFGGFFIPKRTRIRIAVWESHKDPENFDDPFRFKPQRFLGGAPSAAAYAPFGLDKHRCLGADWAVLLSAFFVEGLARRLSWDVLGDAAPERGVFHFEPSRKRSVRFQPRGAR